MNFPSPSSSEKTSPFSGAPDKSLRSENEVVTLACPACHKELNLYHKHVGVQGNCVHCQAPVKAVEDAMGNIVVKSVPIAGSADLPEEPPQSSVWGSSTFPEGDTAFKAPEGGPQSQDKKSDLSPHQSPPPFLTELESEPGKDPPAPFLDSTGEASFTGKPGEQGSVPFSHKRMDVDETKTDSQSIWKHSGETATEPFLAKTNEEPQNPSPVVREEEKTSFFTDGSVEQPTAIPDDLSGPRSPWDEASPAKPDSESPLGAGSPAESLFSGKGTGMENGRSGLGNGENADRRAKTGIAGMTAAAPSEGKLRISKSGSAKSSLFKTIRPILVIALLIGLAFVGVTLTPPEKVETVKKQIKEWLKPGAVLQDYLPFQIPGLDATKIEKSPAASATEAVPNAPTAPYTVPSQPSAKPVHQ